MRIVHLMNTLSNRGNGIINVAVDLAIEQQRAGHHVGIIAGPGGHEELVRSSGVELLALDQKHGAANLLKASLKMRRLLRKFRPDIVHAHMQTGLILALPWTKLYRIPMVTHLHNVHDSGANRMGWADRVIAISAAVKEDLKKQGVPEEKIRVVLNGNLQSPRVPPISSLTPEPLLRPSITTVAGMNHRKGIAELIEAFGTVAQQVGDAQLYLVGDGPERTLFEEQANRSFVRDRIHFEGFNATPQSYLLSTDIFVLASRRESWGLVLIEAREAGCAIVASDVDGIPEALDGGNAGLLVPPQSPKALADALLMLLQNPALRQSWQQRAKIGMEHFTVNRMMKEVLEVYGELVPRSPENAA